MTLGWCTVHKDVVLKTPKPKWATGNDAKGWPWNEVERCEGEAP